MAWNSKFLIGMFLYLLLRISGLHDRGPIVETPPITWWEWAIYAFIALTVSWRGIGKATSSIENTVMSVVAWLSLVGTVTILGSQALSDWQTKFGLLVLALFMFFFLFFSPTWKKTDSDHHPHPR